VATGHEKRVVEIMEETIYERPRYDSGQDSMPENAVVVKMFEKLEVQQS
jgi:hypothetical protein